MTAKSTLLMPTFSMNLGGKLLTPDKPLIMGILNITPDSFYKGSRYERTDSYLKKVEEMLKAGATFLDIGGQSTRPGAQQLSASEERDRVVPAIRNILRAHPEALLSVDTYYSEVAQAAVENGAVMINDISAGEMDQQMIPLVGKLQIPYIAMHMQGTPETMQINPHYEHMVQEIFDYFVRKIALCKEAGIRDLIIDPGFCFGKTLAQNYTLMKHLSVFHQLQKPLLVGISRKSMIYRLLKNTPEEALNGTIALNLLALQQGAQILRVHDVGPARELIQIWEYYLKEA